jgi:hypothetical protein
LKIHHALKETSYLTDGLNLTVSGEIATTIGNYLWLGNSPTPAPDELTSSIYKCHFIKQDDPDDGQNCMPLKLQQGQVWKHGDGFIRIVHLERLEVKYKHCKNLKAGKGKHHHTTKKDFCRLLKSATLLAPKSQAGISPAPAPAT